MSEVPLCQKCRCVRSAAVSEVPLCQKCRCVRSAAVSEVYTEHTRDKMKPLKSVCLKKDVISSSLTNEKISPFLTSSHHFLTGLRPFYTAGSRVIQLQNYVYLIV